MRILIVDDSRVMRMIVQRTLRQAGFGDHELVEAENGVEALESIAANRPDLVLSDWNMPEMTGIQLLKERNNQGAGLKFGFVTSESTPEMREQATANGALFLIAKPFTAETFQEAITPILG
jgi:two-component system, chemotaxis family, chemotaxis protein CheY